MADDDGASRKIGRLSRRGFLGGVLGLAGVGALGALTRSEHGSNEVGPTSPWEEVRRQFDLDPSLIHLAGMLFTSHPIPVREAIERHRWSLDRNPAGYVMENDTKLRVRAVESAAAYFGTEPGCVALTDSTTMGLSLLYQGLELGEGDEVLTTTHDHYSTWYALKLKAQRKDLQVRKISLYEKPAQVSKDELANVVVEAVGPKTRVLALTWVHSDTGVKLPIQEISQQIAARNANRPENEYVLVCVDGVHGFGIEDVEMRDLGCDFFVAGCHKWLHGPRGTGVVYSRRPHLWNGLIPLIPPFGVKNTQGLYHSPGGFHAFEHRWSLTEAFDFHRALGKRRVEARVHALALQLKEGLEEMPKASLHTPVDPALSAGIVSFDFDGATRKGVVRQLLEQGIVITQAPYGLRCLRATPGLANSPEEIETTLRALHRFGKA